MTGKTTTLTQEKSKLERFPDYPPREDMQNWLYLYDSAVLTSLTIHFAEEPNVTVASEVPVGPSLPVRNDARIPDLLVVRDGDRELMEEERGYAIDRQGKAPDFALEVASPTTGRADYTDKRLDYERFGIAEYWRFDLSGGEYHDAALAGDRLVDGVYEPMMRWDCMCAGRMGGCASSTPVRRAIFAPMTKTRLAPKKSVSAVWLLRLALAPQRLALKKSAPVA